MIFKQFRRHTAGKPSTKSSGVERDRENDETAETGIGFALVADESSVSSRLGYFRVIGRISNVASA